MFKDKIVASLKTKYKNFGLSNEGVDRIASAIEKTVTKEEDIETAITTVETMDLIARELMSMRDKEIHNKTDLQTAFDKYKTEHPEGKEPPKPNDPPKPNNVTMESIQELLKSAVQEATKPLVEKISTLENARSSESAIATAKDKFFSGDYAKKYKDEAEAAWERALEINEVQGNKMTAEQLSEKVNGYFNKAVSKLGVDISKPFVADPPANDKEGTIDWAAEKKRLQESGKLPAEK
jgi:hypothetical protein